MLARENPHCGVSGVPFMKSTTGADPTAFSMAVFVSLERKRAARGVMRELEGMREAKMDEDGLATCRKTCRGY